MASMDKDVLNSIVEEVIRNLPKMEEEKKKAAPQASTLSSKKRVKRVALGCDHGGYELKVALKGHLEDLGYRVKDFGTYTRDSVDYPDFALQVARSVARGESDAGIMIDGAGIGSCMAANKVKGVRAAMCYDMKTILNSRDHNDANVLTLGGPLLNPKEAREMVRAWLETPFGGGRHQRRVDKIMAIEKD